MKFLRHHWECFLLPVATLQRFDRLPAHELCRDQLEHVIIPNGRDHPAEVTRELRRGNVCAVSWRWNAERPASATLDSLREWSPMSRLQLNHLKRETAQRGCEYVWIDWCCIPQLTAETMRFINASHD